MSDQFREKMEALISKRDLEAIISPKKKKYTWMNKHVWLGHMRLSI